MRPDQIQILCSSLRISGHLLAPIVNGGGDRFRKWKEFKLSRARDLDLDLGSGHTAYRRASFIDIYLYTKFHSNRRNFLWTDGRTDIFPPLILLGRLLEVDLKMPQRYLYTVHEVSGIPSTTTCKKAKLDEVLAAHCRADLVSECMKRKKNTNIVR